MTILPVPPKTLATRRAATPSSGAPELQKTISASDGKNGTFLHYPGKRGLWPPDAEANLQIGESWL